MKYFSLYVLLISFSILPSCSSMNRTEGKLKGNIIVVGNEPFTKLALQVGENEIYLLKIENKEQEAELQANQGKDYIISYDSSKSYISGDTILVKKVEPAK